MSVLPGNLCILSSASLRISSSRLSCLSPCYLGSEYGSAQARSHADCDTQGDSFTLVQLCVHLQLFFWPGFELKQAEVIILLEVFQLWLLDCYPISSCFFLNLPRFPTLCFGCLHCIKLASPANGCSCCSRRARYALRVCAHRSSALLVHPLRFQLCPYWCAQLFWPLLRPSLCQGCYSCFALSFQHLPLLSDSFSSFSFGFLCSSFCCTRETSLNRVCSLVFACTPCILIFTSLSHMWAVLALQCWREPVRQHLVPGFCFFDSLTKLNHTCMAMATVQDSCMHSSSHTATSAAQFRLFKGFCCYCWVTGLKFDCEFFFETACHFCAIHHMPCNSHMLSFGTKC